MSNRSLLEFNHDYCPRSRFDATVFGHALASYMRAADPRELPPGVVRKHYRHHSDPDPMVMLDQLAGDLRAAQVREGELVAALLEAREVLAEMLELHGNEDCQPADDMCGSGWCRAHGCLSVKVARIDSLLARTTTPNIAAAFRAETESAQEDGV